MKMIAIALMVLLTGCSTVHLEQAFPVAPTFLKDSCKNLNTIPEGTTKLSDVMAVVSANYSMYHECRLKAETWEDWYQRQKKIFETK